MSHPLRHGLNLFSAIALLAASGLAQAADTADAAGDALATKHKVVIQVSTDDVKVQKLALNNAANLQQALGMDNVTVEVVAYGPGLSLYTGESEESSRVPSLSAQNVTFSACGNTIAALTKKLGKEPTLVEGVKVVPAGVARIMELQEQGYSYIRP